jgi:type IV pilus assembly protein PilB
MASPENSDEKPADPNPSAAGGQHGLKAVNLDEVKPSAEALALVPGTMATVYKALPLSIKDNVLTIAIGDLAILPDLDDLRHLLDLKDVVAMLAPAGRVTKVIEECYEDRSWS